MQTTDLAESVFWVPSKIKKHRQTDTCISMSVDLSKLWILSCYNWICGFPSAMWHNQSNRSLQPYRLSKYSPQYKCCLGIGCSCINAMLSLRISVHAFPGKVWYIEWQITVLNLCHENFVHIINPLLVEVLSKLPCLIMIDSRELLTKAANVIPKLLCVENRTTYWD